MAINSTYYTAYRDKEGIYSVHLEGSDSVTLVEQKFLIEENTKKRCQKIMCLSIATISVIGTALMFTFENGDKNFFQLRGFLIGTGVFSSLSYCFR